MRKDKNNPAVLKIYSTYSKYPDTYDRYAITSAIMFHTWKEMDDKMWFEYADKGDFQMLHQHIQ